MIEATVKALTDAIYDALEGSDPVRELDNEQVYEVARLAAQTIEAAGTRVPAQKQIGWANAYGVVPGGLDIGTVPHHWKPIWMDLP